MEIKRIAKLFTAFWSRHWDVLVVLALIFAMVIAFAWQHNVSTALSPYEASVANRLLASYAAVPPGGCDRDLATIVRCVHKAQDIVWDNVAPKGGIPMGYRRGIAELLKWKKGRCYDRSRAIEDLLVAMHLTVRHVSIYQDSLFAGSDKYSHALTEVKTPQGWMVVGSLSKWVGLLPGGRPVSMSYIAQHGIAAFAPQPIRPRAKKILSGKFAYVYGLYSRHGKFYPPYDRVPDVNWNQLLDNL